MNKSIFITLLVAMFGLLHTQAWWLGGWGNRFGYGYGSYYGLYTPYYGLYYPSYTYLTTPYYYIFDEDDSNAMVDDEFDNEEEFSSNEFDNEEEFSSNEEFSSDEPSDDFEDNEEVSDE
jgi:hypothetical protein